jgi:HTH-type transcriptional regulator / antitoxin HipB
MKKVPVTRPRNRVAAHKPKAEEAHVEAAEAHSTNTVVWARAVRARRKALGLTQRELSEYAGCGPAFLYELEQGKQTLRLDKLLDVLEVLGLRLRMEQGARGLVVDSAIEKPSAGGRTP